MKTTTAVLAACLLAVLAACNTVDGAGRDIESGGEAISDTARDVERDLNR